MTARQIAIHFSGHGCMDKLTTEHSFDSQATWLGHWCIWLIFWHVIYGCLYNQVGLGSIGTTSSDRQSHKIDVQHERTSIAELDTAPPTSIVFPTPKIQKSLPYSLKRLRRWAGHHWNCTTMILSCAVVLGKVWRGPRNIFYMVLVRPPPHFSKHYRARQNRIEKIDIEKN